MSAPFCLDAFQDTPRKGPSDTFNAYGGTPADRTSRRGICGTVFIRE
jgi:hypothetical protein